MKLVIIAKPLLDELTCFHTEVESSKKKEKSHFHHCSSCVPHEISKCVPDSELAPAAPCLSVVVSESSCNTSLCTAALLKKTSGKDGCALHWQRPVWWWGCLWRCLCPSAFCPCTQWTQETIQQEELAICLHYSVSQKFPLLARERASVIGYEKCPFSDCIYLTSIQFPGDSQHIGTEQAAKLMNKAKEWSCFLLLCIIQL